MLPNVDPLTSVPIGWDNIVKSHLVGVVVFRYHRVYDPRTNQIREVGDPSLRVPKITNDYDGDGKHHMCLCYVYIGLYFVHYYYYFPLYAVGSSLVRRVILQGVS